MFGEPKHGSISIMRSTGSWSACIIGITGSPNWAEPAFDKDRHRVRFLPSTGFCEAGPEILTFVHLGEVFRTVDPEGLGWSESNRHTQINDLLLSRELHRRGDRDGVLRRLLPRISPLGTPPVRIRHGHMGPQGGPYRERTQASLPPLALGRSKGRRGIGVFASKFKRASSKMLPSGLVCDFPATRVPQRADASKYICIDMFGRMEGRDLRQAAAILRITGHCSGRDGCDSPS